MTKDRPTSHRRIKTILARAVALVLMLCAIAILAAPFASAATGRPCAMACCATLPEHDAVSCAGHESEAAKPVEPARDPGDPLCRPPGAGNTNAPAATETITVVAQPDADISEKAGSALRFAAFHVSEPCVQECGACGSTSARTRFNRYAAIDTKVATHTLYVVRSTADETSALFPLLRGQFYRIVPRGPPLTPQS